MVALIGPQRTYGNLVSYLAHLVAWWVTMCLSSYGLTVYGVPCQVDWKAERPRWWRTEARRGLRACEQVLRNSFP